MKVGEVVCCYQDRKKEYKCEKKKYQNTIVKMLKINIRNVCC
jgi:hypothetical protein